MSDIFKKLKLAAESAKTVANNFIEGKDQLVSNEVYNARMAKCQECPAFNKTLGQCGDCGCFVRSVKGKIQGMKCPRNLWDA